MRHWLKLSAISHAARSDTLDQVTRAISGAGGWVLDHTFYSDVMIVLRLELPAEGTEKLGALLEQSDLVLEAPVPDLSARGAEEIPATLSITLTRGTGDVKNTIPAVDG